MSVVEYVEGEGSAYTVRVDVLDPEVDPEVEREGYRSRTALFVVMSGPQIWAETDRHKLIREMPGQNDWLHEHLRRLADAALDEDDGTLNPVERVAAGLDSGVEDGIEVALCPECGSIRTYWDELADEDTESATCDACGASFAVSETVRVSEEHPQVRDLLDEEGSA